MAKKHLYFNEAERLYIVEQCTIGEIASRLNLGEKTVRLWKEEGDWDTKRKQFLKERQSLAEELFVFARKLARSIMDDWDKGEKVDQGRLYALARLLPMILKVKDYEANLSEKEEKVNLDEVLKKALSETLGE
jgi:uncharacterized protein YjcR